MAPIPLLRPVLARQPLLTSVPGYCQNATEPKGDCICCLGCNVITARATAKAPCIAVWNVPEAFSSCYLKYQFLISLGVVPLWVPGQVTPLGWSAARPCFLQTQAMEGRSLCTTQPSAADGGRSWVPQSIPHTTTLVMAQPWCPHHSCTLHCWQSCSQTCCRPCLIQVRAETAQL